MYPFVPDYATEHRLFGVGNIRNTESGVYTSIVIEKTPQVFSFFNKYFLSFYRKIAFFIPHSTARKTPETEKTSARQHAAGSLS